MYDFKTSTRTGYTELEVPASRVVIVEGIYALSERLREHLDLRVSITGGVHFDLVKRVLRDLDRSGQAPEEIIQQVTAETPGKGQTWLKCGVTVYHDIPYGVYHNVHHINGVHTSIPLYHDMYHTSWCCTGYWAVGHRLSLCYWCGGRAHAFFGALHVEYRNFRNMSLYNKQLCWLLLWVESSVIAA